MGNNYPG